MKNTIYKNRIDAGRALAELLCEYKDSNEAIVYALPRGGVPVAKVIAEELNLPLDLLIIRKIGHPLNPEFAVAAIAEDGTLVSNPIGIDRLDSEWLSREIENQKLEIQRRIDLYFSGKKRIDPKDKITIIVDDGIATGSTTLAAIEAMKSKHPLKIIVATPVVDKSVSYLIEGTDVELVAGLIPEEFAGAVGAYYEDFTQVTDEEVKTLLNE
jgi:predicted phosphoribosyltransferase